MPNEFSILKSSENPDDSFVSVKICLGKNNELIGRKNDGSICLLQRNTRFDVGIELDDCVLVKIVKVYSNFTIVDPYCTFELRDSRNKVIAKCKAPRYIEASWINRGFSRVEHFLLNLVQNKTT